MSGVLPVSCARSAIGYGLPAASWYWSQIEPWHENVPVNESVVGVFHNRIPWPLSVPVPPV